MRILQIEDDAATAQSVELMLKSEGFNVQTTDLGEEGVDLAKIYDYDAITLDLNLPDMNGIDVLRQIRAARVKAPVIVVTGATAIDIKVKCFGAGADDYLAKPFHKDELICRLRALVLRSKGLPEPKLILGNLEIDLGAKRAKVGGRFIRLTGHEWGCLELLALRQGQTCSKDAFMNAMYGGMDEPELKIIDVFICKLRKKLGAAGKMVQTVWGRGYVLSTDELEAPRKQIAERALRPESVRSLIIRAIGDGGARRADIIRSLPGVSVQTLTSTMAIAVADQLIVPTGARGSYRYRLTPAGRALLRQIDGSQAAA